MKKTENTECGAIPDGRYTSPPDNAPNGCTGTVRRECEGVLGERVGQNPGMPTANEMKPLNDAQMSLNAPSRVHSVFSNATGEFPKRKENV